MERQIAGQLFWRDDTYLLVDPDPVLEKRSWLGDNMREFVVCSEDGHVFNLVVTPPFAVSYRRMGEKIQVEEQEVKIQEELASISINEEEDWIRFENWIKADAT